MLFQLPFSPSRRSIPPPAIGTSDCHAHSTTRCKRSFRSGGAHGAAWRGMWGRSGRRSIEREYGTSQHSPADPHSDGNNREGGLCRLPPDSVATPAPAPASAARAAASAGAFLVKRNPSDRFSRCILRQLLAQHHRMDFYPAAGPVPENQNRRQRTGQDTAFFQIQIPDGNQQPSNGLPIE
jgi:hypothetical protein